MSALNSMAIHLIVAWTKVVDRSPNRQKLDHKISPLAGLEMNKKEEMIMKIITSCGPDLNTVSHSASYMKFILFSLWDMMIFFFSLTETELGKEI